MLESASSRVRSTCGLGSPGARGGISVGSVCSAFKTTVVGSVPVADFEPQAVKRTSRRTRADRIKIFFFMFVSSIFSDRA
jgi:hypothetical protein